MFKTVRWRREKNKIKAVFKLQFQATQVPLLGWDALMVSLVPLEVGKPTVISEKASVHDGICRWENPIYETVRFVSEPKTGKINENIYHFLLSTGMSKTSVVGEVAIDFANYADAIKASSVSLPLKTSNYSIVLHITIQRIQAASDGREVEKDGDVMVRSRGRMPKSQLSNCSTDGSYEASNGTENCNSTEEKASLAIQAQLSLSNTNAISHHVESIGILKEFNSSDVVSISSLDSSSGQDNSQELGLISNGTQQDMASFVSSHVSNSTPLNLTAEPVGSIADIRESWTLNTEQSMNSSPDGRIDDLTVSSEDTILKERLQGSDISTEKLKNEMGVLARQAKVSELELQTLRKQIVKERRRGQDLSREVCSLKEQRDALKRECEQLKSSQLNIDSRNISDQFQFDSEDPRHVVEKIRQELNCEKDLNANLSLQLQNTRESNSQLILAVRALEEMEQRNKETDFQPTMYESTPHLHQSETNKGVSDIVYKHEIEDEEQQALEELVKERGDTKVAYSLEQKIIDLCSEIEMYKKDHEELEVQMEQLALDYEILKQENHSMSSKLKQSQVEEQLKMQYECSGLLSVINDLEIHVESLEKELEKQIEAFEANLVVITRAKVEQEQRAIRAEEALRKMKWNNANTAEKLQEEFKVLYMQVSSTFKANEKLVMQASTEASEMRLEKSNLEELLEKANQEFALVKEIYKSKVKELANEIDLKMKQTDQLLLELKEKSKELENQKKSNEERDDAFLEEILTLQTQMVVLKIENKNLSEQVEQKEKLRAEIHTKTSFEEMIMLLQRGNMERDALEKKVASMSEEAEKSMKEFNDMKFLMDEKEKMVGSLQSEVTVLRAQYNDLMSSLFADELEKENLRKNVCNLKGDLQNKEDAITIVHKQLEDNSVKITVADGCVKPTSMNNKSGPAPHGSKEAPRLSEKIKLLEGEIKQKEVALENLTVSFIRQERDLCNRIGELEKAMGELSQNDVCFCKEKFQEVKNRAVMLEDKKDVMENLLKSEMGAEDYIPDQNGNWQRTNQEVEACGQLIYL